jgi:hypothetical protein
MRKQYVTDFARNEGFQTEYFSGRTADEGMTLINGAFIVWEASQEVCKLVVVTHDEAIKELKAAKHPKALTDWYRENPDDAGEHTAQDIFERFGGEVTREQAQAFYEKLQHDRYGPNWNDNPYKG